MFPVLQINCDELPQPVDSFGNAKLLVVYMSRTRIPFDEPHKQGWEIREYLTLNGLVPTPAKNPEYLRPQPIRWKLGEPEAPGWEQSWDLVDMNPINESEEASGDFFDLPHYGRTKIGGYSSDIQHLIGNAGGFVFQISSEEKANLNWVDSGKVYFSKSDSGEWEFDIQFY